MFLALSCSALTCATAQNKVSSLNIQAFSVLDSCGWLLFFWVITNKYSCHKYQLEFLGEVINCTINPLTVAAARHNLALFLTNNRAVLNCSECHHHSAHLRITFSIPPQINPGIFCEHLIVLWGNLEKWCGKEHCGRGESLSFFFPRHSAVILQIFCRFLGTEWLSAFIVVYSSTACRWCDGREGKRSLAVN